MDKKDNNDEKLTENQSNEIDTVYDEEDIIEFDDNIDIEALQSQLQEHMKLENVEYTPEKTQEKKTVEGVAPKVELAQPQGLVPVQNSEILTQQENNPAEFKKVPHLKEKLKLAPGEKKFVIYIEPENLDFIEGLTLKERKRLINNVLHEQDDLSKRRREAQERAKFTKQVIIMVLTVVLALPIFFVLLNKSVEVTILNYQQAQQNFVKLYKEQGKIKSYKSFQKHFQ